jgi:filamentous hemagglutinin family protein
MNRHCHRLVHNARLGALVPVAETARSHGKPASGAQRARGAPRLAALAAAAVCAAAGGGDAVAQLPREAANFRHHGQAQAQVIHERLMHVNQVGNRAILNWQQFNVGRGAEVQFRQVEAQGGALVPGAAFTTLNRIHDAHPSRIAGAITQGAGQQANIFLINANGIVFAQGAQVNVHSITASTLGIADSYVIDRLLDGRATVPQFAGGMLPVDPANVNARIVVEEGARLTAGSQGRVMLIAPQVENRGHIEAPDGQVVLAAGTRAYLRAAGGEDANLRGLLVEVDNAAGSPGRAVNLGTLSAPRGNVTMVGHAVNQSGIARATSSVLANGTVYLLARDTPAASGGTIVATRAGRVELGARSRTEVLPETSDATTTADGEGGRDLPRPGLVRVQGQQVLVQAEATVAAPAGRVELSAVDSPAAARLPGTPASTDAWVHVASGARIDVAGLRGVQLQAGRSMLPVELRGDELKDSPVNRHGPLRGRTVYMDIERALERAEAGESTLVAADSLRAYAQRIERSIAERSTRGGSVDIASEGSAVVEHGVTIDLSGGSLDFQQAVVRSDVLSAQGRLVGVAEARADVPYDAIVSQYIVEHARWNRREVIVLPSGWQHVQGYVEGRDAGSLSVSGPGAVVMQAALVGETVTGTRQQALGRPPRGPRVQLGREIPGTGGQPPEHTLNQRVVLGRRAQPLVGHAPGAPLPQELVDELTLDMAQLRAGAVAELTVLSNQAVEVREALRLPQGGVLSVAAPEVRVGADIDAPAGRIGLTARAVATQPFADARLQVADGVTLSARGAWVNERPGTPAGDGSLAMIDGGSVSLQALSRVDGGSYASTGRLLLGRGVSIDASGGAHQPASGALRGGRGGSIVLHGHDLQGFNEASVQAWGWRRGGSLSLAAREVRVAEAPPEETAGAAARPDLLWLDPGHFSRGGFASHSVRALDRLEVADGTRIHAQVQHRVGRPDAALHPTGTPMAALTQTLLRPVHEREAATLTLHARQDGADTGELRIGRGAQVEVDPGGSIGLEARNQLVVDGTLRAPGGRLTLAARIPPGIGFQRQQPPPHLLWLGAQARLDAAGTTLTWRDARGLRQGRVLPGGEVRLSTSGALVAQPGAVVDVSGTPTVRLDLVDEAGRIGRELAGDAGAIRIDAQRMAFEGRMAAQAGAVGQRGGVLDVQIGRNARIESQVGFDAFAAELRLQPGVAPQTAALTPAAQLPPDGVVMARLDAGALQDSGIERLRLGGSDALVLADGVALGDRRELREVELDFARIDTEGQASLHADTVRLGNYDTRNRVGSAGREGPGSGSLEVEARLLELAGDLRLQGHADATLTGREEIRLAGVTRDRLRADGTSSGQIEHAATIDSTGDLTLRAGRVTTGTMADVQLRAPGRTLRFESGGAPPQAPLLASVGRLRVEARDIVQAGRIELPSGSIELRATDTLSLAPGSLTSVALPSGALLPLGRVRNATDWIVDVRPDQVPEGQLRVQAVAPRAVLLDGADVTLAAGATVDVSGGGDLQAWEFTVGPGGSRDILAQPGMVAVLPGAQPGWANADPQHATGLPAGEAIELRGVSGLPDGRYTLLPAHYALLPGGHALRLAPNASTLLPGQAHTRGDGVRVAAGRVTDTRPDGATAQGDWRAVEVWTQAQVRERSEYTLRRASEFLQSGGRLADAGLLAVQARNTLVLDAQLRGAAGAGGRGAAVDLVVPRLALVGAGGAPVTDPAAVRIEVAQLNALGASSLLLGALRETAADGATRLDVGTDQLTLANGEASALRADEVILAARETLTLADGAQVVVTPPAQESADAGVYRVDGDGALLRVAASTAQVERDGNIARSRGNLVGAADSLVRGRSVTLDATQDNRYAGEVRIDGADGQLAIGASRVHFGTPAGTADGLVLMQGTLDALPALQALTLTSYSGFDLHGPVTVGSAGLHQLRLQGGGLAGHGAAGEVATLRAAELEWANPGGVTAAAGDGGGALVVAAQRLLLGAGDKAVTGFGAVQWTAADELRASDSGTTTMQAATTVETARLTGNAGAQQTLRVDPGATAGTLTVQAPAQPTTTAAAAGLGAGWTLAAPTVRFDTHAELPSGSLAIEAGSGGVVVGADARIDVAGRAVDFFDVTRSTWGGTVRLQSTGGDVRADPGSLIDVSGGPGADAGRLQVSAPQGTATLAGTLRGAASADAAGSRGDGGRFELDANTIDELATLAAALHHGGFDAALRLRQRSGDLSLAAGSMLRGQQIALAADAGSAFVAGTLAGTGAAGARIEVHARDRVELLAGGRIDAATTDGDGARVELGVDPSAGGRIVLHGGSVIDVSPGAGGAAGRVTLRAPRIGHEVAVDTGTPGAAGATVIGAAALDVEAVQVYSGVATLTATGASAGTTLSLDTVRSDNAAYAAHHAAIGARLGAGLSGGIPVRLLSGVEVRAGGDLRLGSVTGLTGWAIHDWNLGDPAAPDAAVAGVLSLRAAGNLVFNSHLSDGFVAAGLRDGDGVPIALLAAGARGGLGWSYRLVAGADLGAADPLATRADMGDVVLAAGRHVRSGTGDIRVAAGRDIRLAGAGSVIYSAGAPAPALPGFRSPALGQRAVFTQGGGDVTLQAGRDVVGAMRPPVAGTGNEQLFNEWLFRQGRLAGVNADDPASYSAAVGGNPAWWVRFDNFQQGVGALGGGSVTVTAGRDVDTLTAVAPTQGRMAADEPDPSRLHVSGGGDVRIDAGRDVRGGQTLAGRGEVRVVAGGRIGAGGRVLGQPLHPIVGLMNDATARLQAQGDVQVLAIVNPTLLPQSSGAGFNLGGAAPPAASVYSTYGSDAAATLVSLGGRTALHGPAGGNPELPAAPLSTASSLMRSAEATRLRGGLATHLPPSLEMTAFDGDVVLGRPGAGGLTTMPSATGRLALLAGESVRIRMSLTQSDVDPAQAASVLRPVLFAPDVLPGSALAQARVPLRHALPEPARLYAVRGDVAGLAQVEQSGVSVRLAQQAQVRAGRDVRDLNLRLQHAQAADRSLIEAGRDLRYAVGSTRTDGDGIRIGGPGRLMLAAGRHVDLGTSEGVLSRGNLDNVNLPGRGADIEILAAAGAPAIDAGAAVQRLADRLATAGAGGDDTDLWLARWLVGRDDLSAADAPAALAALQTLPAQTLHDRVRDFLFTAARTSGRDAVQSGGVHTGDYARGYAAVELVFPGLAQRDAAGALEPPVGSLNLFASRVRTDRGGNIDILVPGGGIVVGLPDTPLDLVGPGAIRGSGALGILTAAGGGVRALTRDDILVNQSRILTVAGGDILLWVSEGNIDAGRGAKTATAVPPPQVVTLPDGRVVIEVQGAAQGSGIGALSVPGVEAGTVDLFAPRGTVDAGDAGIRAGNLFIGALVVLGADNIAVGGAAVGVPTPDTTAVSAAETGATTGGGDSERIVEAIAQGAAAAAQAAQQLAAALRPTVVTVEVLGFGD